MNHIAVFSRLVSWQVENPPHPYTAYNYLAKNVVDRRLRLFCDSLIKVYEGGPLM